MENWEWRVKWKLEWNKIEREEKSNKAKQIKVKKIRKIRKGNKEKNREH